MARIEVHAEMMTAIGRRRKRSITNTYRSREECDWPAAADRPVRSHLWRVRAWVLPALSALVMLGLSPLVTTGLAVASGQERGDFRLWTGLAVGVAGLAISLAPSPGTGHVGVGIGVTVFGMLGLAAGTVLQKRWAGDTDPRVSAAVQNLTAATLVLPAAVAFDGRFRVSAQLLLSIGWLGWGMSIGSLLLLAELLRRHAASTVAALLLLVPAITAIASALTLGEQLHPASLVGMLVAMAGVATVLRGLSRAGRRPSRSRGRSTSR
jgi:drug/metabolite transporter (DMT)-like permease